jgi:hypothetical protein
VESAYLLSVSSFNATSHAWSGCGTFSMWNPPFSSPVCIPVAEPLACCAERRDEQQLTALVTSNAGQGVHPVFLLLHQVQRTELLSHPELRIGTTANDVQCTLAEGSAPNQAAP